jgi:phosphate transport system substrate-binding protein
VQPFAERWVDAYRAGHPGLPIHVQGGGSTAGVEAAISGAAQIGMSSRRLTAAEQSRLTGVLVARDGIAVVVHPSNGVRALTMAELRALFAGRIARWRQLGGPDAEITLITREEGSGTRSAFESLVMGPERIAASALVQDSTGGVRQMVAGDPNAIGYVSLGLVDGSVRALRLDGVAPTEATIDGGGYPLVRPFFFVFAGEPTGPVKALIEWITGPEGRSLTRREGLLPPRG